MISWLRRRSPADSPRTKNRETPSTKVNFAELTPTPLNYLGQLASVTLEQFEQFAACVIETPELLTKERLSVSAAASVARHQAVVEEIRSRNENVTKVMSPFSAQVDTFHAAIVPRSWNEKLLTVYVTSGLLDEFFIGLAEGLPGGLNTRMAHILAGNAGREAIAEILCASIAADPDIASRLALWGRRLVGDTLLLARSALCEAKTLTPRDELIEPVFTSLISSHTRRMDQLGLTA